MTDLPDLSAPVLKATEPYPLFDQQAVFVPSEIKLLPKSLFWLGYDEEKVLFKAQNSEGQPLLIQTAVWMREDEKIIFRAFQDWYAGALRKASENVRGYYTFEVLQFFVGDAPRSWTEFAGLLSRHAAKQAVLERRLIQFGSLWGILEKRTEADFGRIESKLQVHFFKPNAENLFKNLKKKLNAVPVGQPAAVLFRDESRQCLIEEEDAVESLKKVADLGAVSTEERQGFFWHPASKRLLRI